MTTAEVVRERLTEVVDPCSAATGSNLDIVEMGLLKSVEVSDGRVVVELRLTTPVCQMVPYFVEEIEERVEPLPGVESVTVETDGGMEWTEEMMTESGRERREATLKRYEDRYDRDDVPAQ